MISVTAAARQLPRRKRESDIRLQAVCTLNAVVIACDASYPKVWAC
jgi:hypothetical protein